MKSKIIIGIFLILIVLTSCNTKGPSTIKFDGKVYTLSSYDKDKKTRIYELENKESFNNDETQKNTITVEGNISQYVINYKGKNYIVEGNKHHISVTYPNGEKANASYGDNGGGFEAFGNVSGYPDIDDFRELVLVDNSLEFNGGQFLVSIGLIIFSLLCVISPEVGWYLNRGWVYKKAESSDFYLGVCRISGVIGCIIGILLLFTSCSA